MIDYAHNEAGLEALLDTAEGLLGKRGKRRATMTVVIGTAGDRPEDSLRAIGRLAAERGDRVAIKESLTFLRGRTRAAVIGELLAGVRAAGVAARPTCRSTTTSSSARGAARAPSTDEPSPHVIVEMCHEQRTEVRDLPAWRGLRRGHRSAHPRALPPADARLITAGAGGGPPGCRSDRLPGSSRATNSSPRSLERRDAAPRVVWLQPHAETKSRDGRVVARLEHLVAHCVDD